MAAIRMAEVRVKSMAGHSDLFNLQRFWMERDRQTANALSIVMPFCQFITDIEENATAFQLTPYHQKDMLSDHNTIAGLKTQQRSLGGWNPDLILLPDLQHGPKETGESGQQ